MSLLFYLFASVRDVFVPMATKHSLIIDAKVLLSGQKPRQNENTNSLAVVVAYVFRQLINFFHDGILLLALDRLKISLGNYLPIYSEVEIQKRSFLAIN